MARHLTGLDHALIAVRDLDRARSAFERLGFVATPLGRHPGHGTGNHCLMFERDYVELLGALDPDQASPNLMGFLGQREGGYGLALRTSDAGGTREAWADAGLEPDPVEAFARTLDGGVELRFDNVRLDRARTAGLTVFACHPRDPAALRRPEWVAHPNGAVGITGITLISPTPVALEPAFGAIFGRGSLTETDHTLAVHVGRHVVLIVSPEDLEAFHPGFEADDIEVEEDTAALVGLTVAVRDLDATVKVLEDNGVRFKRAMQEKLLVAPGEAAGVMLEFNAAH